MDTRQSGSSTIEIGIHGSLNGKGVGKRNMKQRYIHPSCRTSLMSHLQTQWNTGVCVLGNLWILTKKVSRIKLFLMQKKISPNFITYMYLFLLSDNQ